MISLMTLLFAVSANAQPELRQKPVQCGAFAEVYEAYIKPNNLSPMFTGVATIQTQTGGKMVVPTVFYLNYDDGRWLWIETDQSETCVINLGDGFDADIDENVLMQLLMPKTT